MNRSLSRLPIAFALIGALLSPAANAGFDVASGVKVSFSATGSPGFLDIEGKSATMTVADDGSKLTFTVPMTTVKTGIENRDEHMNDKYVQIAQFPNAVLTVDKAAITWPSELGDKSKGKVTADFNIHGQSQPVEVEWTAQKSKTGYRVTGSFNFDTARSGITIPDYLGVTVDPKIMARVTADLTDAR